ncbi:transglutaminase-like domain-containing protein [Heyndrickxia sp. NPDC080065]|uniref:transglutaminase-like domain-containing protein n=1 Tax=Heyndrickxia sp. NPDC080065 TaxID=3390568 RepID=UPI003CFE0CB2
MSQTIEVTRFKGSRIRGDINSFNWENSKHPKLDILREKYALDKLISSRDEEFEKVLKLMNWVHNCWKHDPQNAASNQNALVILSEVEKGFSFRCVEYATLLVQICTSFGIPSRHVRLIQPYPSGPIEGEAHFVTEIWINKFNKWICFDPQTNSYWTYRGIPLGVLELQDIACKKKTQGLKWHRKSPLNLYKYFEIKLSEKNIPIKITPVYLKLYSLFKAKKEFLKFFIHPRFYPANMFDKDGKLNVKEIEFVNTNGEPPQLVYLNKFENYRFTGDPSIINFSCNLVDIQIMQLNSRKISIKLKHCVPWFKQFFIRCNKSDWVASSDSFDWLLSKGENLLEVKAVNNFNMDTSTSYIEVIIT